MDSVHSAPPCSVLWCQQGTNNVIIPPYYSEILVCISCVPMEAVSPLQLKLTMLSSLWLLSCNI